MNNNDTHPIDTLTKAVKDTLGVPEFIESLNRLIPHCHPRVTDSEREIWIRVGKRELVQELAQIQKLLEESEDS
jgi:hypothetical protein